MIMTLKELRQSKRLNQLDASKIVNVPLRTYKRYENDDSYCNSFKYDQIYKLIQNYNQGTVKKEKTDGLKITVAGIGYVGLSLAVLLSENNEVIITDILKEKIEIVNNKKAPFADSDISYYLTHKKLYLVAKENNASSYRDADIVIVLDLVTLVLLTATVNVSK